MSSSLQDNFIKKESIYGAQNYSPLSVVLEKGEGAYLRDVDGNKLTSIPQSIFGVNTLRNFKISNNDISNVPVEIKNLKKLYDIDLRNNTISSLPNEIINLKNTLKYIFTISVLLVRLPLAVEQK